MSTASDKEIRDAMARAMFVTAWADQQEEKGRHFPPRTEIMNVAPRTNREAFKAANALLVAMVKANHVHSITDLYDRAVQSARRHGESEGTPKEFGHYMAMQAMGHGVSWFDDRTQFPIKIPRIEFYL